MLTTGLLLLNRLSYTPLHSTQVPLSHSLSTTTIIQQKSEKEHTYQPDSILNHELSLYVITQN